MVTIMPQQTYICIYLQAVGPVTALFITLVVVSGFADSRGSGSCVDADGAIEIIWLLI